MKKHQTRAWILAIAASFVSSHYSQACSALFSNTRTAGLEFEAALGLLTEPGLLRDDLGALERAKLDAGLSNLESSVAGAKTQIGQDAIQEFARESVRRVRDDLNMLFNMNPRLREVYENGTASVRLSPAERATIHSALELLRDNWSKYHGSTPHDISILKSGELADVRSLPKPAATERRAEQGAEATGVAEATRRREAEELEAAAAAARLEQLRRKRQESEERVRIEGGDEVPVSQATILMQGLGEVPLSQVKTRDDGRRAYVAGLGQQGAYLILDRRPIPLGETRENHFAAVQRQAYRKEVQARGREGGQRRYARVEWANDFARPFLDSRSYETVLMAIRLIDWLSQNGVTGETAALEVNRFVNFHLKWASPGDSHIPEWGNYRQKFHDIEVWNFRDVQKIRTELVDIRDSYRALKELEVYGASPFPHIYLHGRPDIRAKSRYEQHEDAAKRNYDEFFVDFIGYCEFGSRLDMSREKVLELQSEHLEAVFSSKGAARTQAGEPTRPQGVTRRLNQLARKLGRTVETEEPGSSEGEAPSREVIETFLASVQGDPNQAIRPEGQDVFEWLRSEGARRGTPSDSPGRREAEAVPQSDPRRQELGSDPRTPKQESGREEASRGREEASKDREAEEGRREVEDSTLAGTEQLADASGKTRVHVETKEIAEKIADDLSNPKREDYSKRKEFWRRVLNEPSTTDNTILEACIEIAFFESGARLSKEAERLVRIINHRVTFEELELWHNKRFEDEIPSARPKWEAPSDFIAAAEALKGQTFTEAEIVERVEGQLLRRFSTKTFEPGRTDHYPEGGVRVTTFEREHQTRYGAIRTGHEELYLGRPGSRQFREMKRTMTFETGRTLGEDPNFGWDGLRIKIAHKEGERVVQYQERTRAKARTAANLRAVNEGRGDDIGYIEQLIADALPVKWRPHRFVSIDIGRSGVNQNNPHTVPSVLFFKVTPGSEAKPNPLYKKILNMVSMDPEGILHDPLPLLLLLGETMASQNSQLWQARPHETVQEFDGARDGRVQVKPEARKGRYSIREGFPEFDLRIPPPESGQWYSGH